jgi:serine/threonine-protein phosphatase 2A regulatory subunit A
MWRVRLAIIEYMPLLAKQLGQQYFVEFSVNEENLSSLSMSWLSDEVHAIREAACANVKNLAVVFGEEWATTVLIPQIKKMRASTNYLARLTTLGCVSQLSEFLSEKATTEHLLPLATDLAEDPVPNVRFNVANTLQKIMSKLEKPAIDGQVKPLLQTMCEDLDPDVKYFSYVALQSA